ncbi:T9SS type A sorting domain-containing protein [Limibacter armeniacum]|uniref:T9SS type A sorting domain-containing protein n=1 Tax=Limibacter armeniacum TaxID=466084 RepID=UPI002FE5EAFC
MKNLRLLLIYIVCMAALSHLAIAQATCEIQKINDLTVTEVTCAGVTIAWSDDPCAIKYLVRRKIKGQATFTNLTFVDEDVNTYTDDTVEPGITYIYMVRPDDGSRKENSNFPEVTIPDCPDCEGVSDLLTLDSQAIDCQRVTLSWDIDLCAEGYKVFRKTETDLDFSLIGTINSGDITSYSDRGLKYSSYQYQVKPYNSLSEATSPVVTVNLPECPEGTGPWPGTIPRSEFYQVTITQADGTVEEIFTHVSKPNLTIGPPDFSHGVTGILHNRSLSFASFSMDQPVTVEVTKLYGEASERVELSPKAYGVNPHYFDGNTVRFELDKPKYISVHFVGDDNQDPDGSGGFDILNGMMIFADKPEDSAPDPTASNVVVFEDGVDITDADIVYFPAGDHWLENTFPLGRIYVSRPNQKFYLEEGAYVRGSIDGEGKDGLWLYGRGIITGNDFPWHHIRENGKKVAYIQWMGVDDAHIEGVTITNPFHHTIPTSKRTFIKHLKIIGWASNMDGIRPGGDSFVDSIFIKTSDDYDYARDPHTVQNSVFWPMRNGATGQLGWNNLGQGKAVYRNCFWINSEWNGFNRNRGVIGSVLNQGANLMYDTLENIVCENYTSILANITMEFESNAPWDPSNPGEISHFLFKNVKMEQPFLAANGKRIMQPIRGFEKDGVKATVHDIRFVNLVAGNTLVTEENYTDYFDIDPNTTYNITFETEGEVFDIISTSNTGGLITPSGSVPVPEGTNQTLSIIADEGYRIKDVMVDGFSKGRLQTLAFENVNQNHQVEVIFEEGEDFFNMILPTLDLRDGHNTFGFKNEKSGNVKVYPNPAVDHVNVDFSELEEVSEVQVVDWDGNIVMIKKAPQGNGNLMLPLQQLVSGTYLIRVFAKDGVHIFRLLL